MSARRLLLVDDSDDFCKALERALRRDYCLLAAASAEEAEARLVPPPDAVLLDLRLDEEDPENSAALGLLERLRVELPQVPVIMITAYGDVESAVECMRLGAADFIQKSGDLRELKARIDKALEQARVVRRLEELERELQIVEPRELVGRSAGMCTVKELIAAVARDAQITALITGETGTGKELVARAIHASGPRSETPFVPVAIAALPPSTLEAELFGYEPGAFTDAKRRHPGLIERAQGGVLFLDEIGELAAELQVKLLRFLEERAISRLGGRQEIRIDLQVVAATNADLGGLIREGRFREDLFYRLKVCEIRIPPLRERREDIELLAQHYLERLGGTGGEVTAIAPAVIEHLRSYSWPGNVRELRNSLEAALLKAGLRNHTRIEVEDLPVEIRTQAALGEKVQAPPAEDVRKRTTRTGHLRDSATGRPLEEVLAEAELREVERALKAVGGKKTEAWKVLGLNDRFVFSRRVKRLCERYPELARGFPAVSQAFLQT